MRGSWKPRAARVARASTAAVLLALPMLGACQLLGGIEVIRFAADAAADALSGDGRVIPPGPTREGPPCSTGEGGVCVPPGGYREGKFCSAGRLINCGRAGDPCCPGGTGTTTGLSPDFCADLNTRCEADSGYCVEANPANECGEPGKPCCSLLSGVPTPCGQGCCDWPTNKCVSFGSTCSEGLCRQDLGAFSCGCGGADQPCCSGATCLEPLTTCIEGTCRRCGFSEGMPCCRTASGPPSCMALAGVVCGANGTCTACGGIDAGCCIGSSCNEGTCDPKTGTCALGASCGGCGAPGEPCCGGACSAGACCDPDRNVCVAQGAKCANGYACGQDARCACGAFGHECCPHQLCDGPVTAVTCAGNKCVTCGQMGDVCCAGAKCSGTRPCDGGSCAVICDGGVCQ